uniref:Peptidase S1 domain-containing protein n=1 Tax=Romanomermis culicivorax TaxID=13658 RepID=A0A915KY55_ROMCU
QNTVPIASDELQCIEVKVEEEKPNQVRRKSLLTIHWHEMSLQGPYKGDSGSPLFCRLIYDPKKFLYGVVTSGASITLSGLTYFERIPSNLEWINQIMDRGNADSTDGGACCFSFKFVSKWNEGQRQSEPVLPW